MTTAHYETIATPDGPFTVISTTRGVIAAGWTTDIDDLLSRVHADLQPSELVSDGDATRPFVEAVHSYYAGAHDAPTPTPVQQHGGEFIQRCWAELRAVPPGATISYTDLATRAGNPRAARAAASACANNAVALFIPCHRVLPKNGSVGGFRYGPELKDSLLHREAEHTPED
ncbi:methylated-DNA--[protein]-cysteine S-methyltransferase [Corynebacterium sp.]|uniref:methylated-DNA--[protein]-cysteine S-methyltransferase n=1 Tax=Corynebacterium sp. TaxID=1720 RepID=UPI0026DC4207|nr:methylated-DNA--[protein]-cysteine S-methyltransferase [Corynebacterium sp.]MDO5077840.1 methylated-DNA--[protein]-cysteine S-methyltransferase [Corynebacterium sp.]